ncbi:MAG: hypothetical protein AAGJ52_07240 [Pseudomonadota bacterium]
MPSILSGPRRRRQLGLRRAEDFIPFRHRLWRQVQRHSVALISLLVAVVGLSYNTWRNETSELHRNWRQAAFVINADLNELRQIVLYRRYFHSQQDHMLTELQGTETWIRGWGIASSVRDLTRILPDPLPELGQGIHGHWSEHAGDLDESGEIASEAERQMIEQIDETQDAVLNLIDQLR